MAYKDKQIELQYYRDYYLKNIEKKKKYKLEQYQKHKEYRKEWSRKKYQSNKELYKERSKEYAKTLSSRWSSLKRSAAKRNYEVSITREMFELIVSKPCIYCGESEKIIGVDRQDNSIGYTEENSKPCCKMCNVMKLNFSLEDFKNHIARIFIHQTNIIK